MLDVCFLSVLNKVFRIFWDVLEAGFLTPNFFPLKNEVFHWFDSVCSWCFCLFSALLVLPPLSDDFSDTKKWHSVLSFALHFSRNLRMSGYTLWQCRRWWELTLRAAKVVLSQSLEDDLSRCFCQKWWPHLSPDNGGIFLLLEFERTYPDEDY